METWSIIVSVVAGVWVLLNYKQNRDLAAITATAALVNRLITGDDIIIDNPCIQKYMSETATKNEEYFRDEAILAEDIFYKAKSFAYRQLNLFDDIVCSAAKTEGKFSFLTPPASIELTDWETYIIEKLRHPLYKSILNNEGHIFGELLRKFFERHKVQIDSKPYDRFLW